MTTTASCFKNTKISLNFLNHVNDKICRTFSDCLLTVKMNNCSDSAPAEYAAFIVTPSDGGEGHWVNMQWPHCPIVHVSDTSSPQRARQCGESVSLNCSTTDRQRASFNIQPCCLLSSPWLLSPTPGGNGVYRKSRPRSDPGGYLRGAIALWCDWRAILASQQVSLKWPACTGHLSVLRRAAGCWDGL